MELYLLRHGKSLANEQQLVCGSSDYPLSPEGREQAQRVCEMLKNIPFTRIYSSSLSRAVNTIAGLACGNRVKLEDELKELNTGDVSHITLSELWEHDARFRQPWLSPDLRYPGGETFREMIVRITGWYGKNASGWSDDERVLIAGHEGTLRSIYLYLMSLDISLYPDFPISNCDYLYFKISHRKVFEFKHVALAGLKGEVI
ncbi:histidine phosphatase family protein [Lonsdalea quercina]|uniref:histidine phosphatase family protein n=1 Tax=Lonsdalea quercina TaxID=71657 RepID=UPI00397527D0